MPVKIDEAPFSFSIAWSATYRLDGDVFHVQYGDGAARSIAGYPVDQIRDSLRQNQAGREQ